jgi:hypothetical protein
LLVQSTRTKAGVEDNWYANLDGPRVKITRSHDYRITKSMALANASINVGASAAANLADSLDVRAEMGSAGISLRWV